MSTYGRIDPLEPHGPSIEPIPRVRRNAGATDREEAERPPSRRRPPPPPRRPPPPDDGLPHVDVTV